ncbi:ABC transporter substrate-binding protein [Jatrophihabitans fulvus]
MNSVRSIGRRAFLGAAAATLAVTLAACGSDGGGGGGSSAPGTGSGSGGSADLPGKGKPSITLGDKDFAEQYLLGELYAQALKAKGYTVNLKENIGSSEVIDKALTSGQIDGYPEYTGVIYTVLANLGDQPKSKEITYEGAKKWEAKRGYTVLEPTPFQDADGVATTKSYAAKNGLKTIDDLKKVSSFTYLGPPENATRFQGVVGLKKAYGLSNFTFKPLKTGSQYTALDNGQADTIAIFTTDAQLASGKYAVLTDTKGIFGFQQVAPVINTKKLAQMGPEFPKILNQVSALLTTDAIIAMNKAVQIDQKDPADVAKAFLQANKLA